MYFHFWRGCKTCTKQELLSLIGQLGHACKVVKPGRIFLSQMIKLSTVAKKLNHHIPAQPGISSRPGVVVYVSCAVEWGITLVGWGTTIGSPYIRCLGHSLWHHQPNALTQQVNITIYSMYHVSPYPIKENILCKYAAYLADQGLHHQTIKCAIRHQQISLGLPDLYMSALPHLEQILRGIKVVKGKQNQSTNPRLPITPAILATLTRVPNTRQKWYTARNLRWLEQRTKCLS